MSDNNTEKHNTDNKVTEEDKKIGPLKVIGSVLSAMIGIQTEENRERDFTSGQIGNYIFVGIIVVAIFIFSLIAIVNNILEDAGM